MTTHRLILGKVSSPILLAGNEVEKFPRAADQPDGLDWLVLGDFDQFSAHAEIFEAFNGYRYGHGAGSFQWEILMSAGMIDWWRRTFYGKTDSIEGGYTAQVTAYTPDTTLGNGWRTVTALMQFPEPARMQREGSTWRIVLQFNEAMAAASGADLTCAIVDAGSGNWLDNATRAFTLSVANEGDYQTTASIVLTVPIPAKTDFSAIVASGWSIEYSVNNATSYSGTAPGDLSTVTHLRLTRITALAASATTTATLTLVATDTGAVSLTASVTTSSESNVSNNTDELEIDIV